MARPLLDNEAPEYLEVVVGLPVTRREEGIARNHLFNLDTLRFREEGRWYRAHQSDQTRTLLDHSVERMDNVQVWETTEFAEFLGELERDGQGDISYQKEHGPGIVDLRIGLLQDGSVPFKILLLSIAIRRDFPPGRPFYIPEGICSTAKKAISHLTHGCPVHREPFLLVDIIYTGRKKLAERLDDIVRAIHKREEAHDELHSKLHELIGVPESSTIRSLEQIRRSHIAYHRGLHYQIGQLDSQPEKLRSVYRISVSSLSEQNPFYRGEDPLDQTADPAGPIPKLTSHPYEAAMPPRIFLLLAYLTWLSFGRTRIHDYRHRMDRAKVGSLENGPPDMFEVLSDIAEAVSSDRADLASFTERDGSALSKLSATSLESSSEIPLNRFDPPKGPELDQRFIHGLTSQIEEKKQYVDQALSSIEDSLALLSSIHSYRAAAETSSDIKRQNTYLVILTAVLVLLTLFLLLP